MSKAVSLTQTETQKALDRNGYSLWKSEFGVQSHPHRYDQGQKQRRHSRSPNSPVIRIRLRPAQSARKAGVPCVAIRRCFNGAVSGILLAAWSTMTRSIPAGIPIAATQPKTRAKTSVILPAGAIGGDLFWVDLLRPLTLVTGPSAVFAIPILAWILEAVTNGDGTVSKTFHRFQHVLSKVVDGLLVGIMCDDQPRMGRRTR